MNSGQQPPRKNERDIFLGALEHPTPEARAAYLDGACGGDPALRAAVEGLLLNYKQDSFLESPAIDSPQLAATGRARGGTAIVGAVTEKPGDMVGRYKLMEKIGEGGFGAVYVAEQREPVKRHVALKIIKPGMDTRQVVARFEAERQALAMMEHLSIAKVLDAGAMPSGRPYFVMELVRGIKITDYCDQHKLSTEDRLGLFVQTCLATQHAHQRGIIHRDIKPSNILVTLYDGVPVPKVIDFGIAKATQGELTDKTIYTELQMFMGTPVYMSPEQAEMSGLPIDTRSDIYSLGVLLYELLTGRTPFDQGELLGAGLDEMRRIIREKEPPRPSTCLGNMPESELTTTAARRRTDAPKLMLSLRGDLDWIVMKCLEKDRTRRYDTAASLAADVQRYLRNELVLARPPSLFYRLRKLLRRNKSVVTIIIAVLAGVMMGLLLAGWLAFHLSHIERERNPVLADPTVNMNGKP
jgi:serine/threonine protein kinase